jgi:c-di-GMP-related signal transduction protein
MGVNHTVLGPNPERFADIRYGKSCRGEPAAHNAIGVRMPDSTHDQNVRQSLERAHFCESLAPSLHESPEELYMLGMLSMMDSMMDISMKTLLKFVFVNSRIEDALLGSPKGLGKALELCRYRERGGESTDLLYGDAIFRDSYSRYVQALISTSSLLHALGA